MHLENISLIMLAESGAILNTHGKMGLVPKQFVPYNTIRSRSRQRYFNHFTFDSLVKVPKTSQFVTKFKEESWPYH
jgi:hypothetical protein